MSTITRQDTELLIVEFKDGDDLLDAMEIVGAELIKRGNHAVNLMYLPPGIPRGDFIMQRGYIGFRIREEQQ